MEKPPTSTAPRRTLVDAQGVPLAYAALTELAISQDAETQKDKLEISLLRSTLATVEALTLAHGGLDLLKKVRDDLIALQTKPDAPLVLKQGVPILRDKTVNNPLVDAYRAGILIDDENS